MSWLVVSLTRLARSVGITASAVACCAALHFYSDRLRNTLTYISTSNDGPVASIGIFVGKERFSSGVFVRDWRVGPVTSIHVAPNGGPVRVAGSTGALTVGASGEVESSTLFRRRCTAVSVVQEPRSARYSFVDRGGFGWQDSATLDDSGRVRWSFGDSSGVRDGVNDMAGGDLRGDGALEFVVGLNGDGGIRSLDVRGHEIWRQQDENVWSVRLTDSSTSAGCRVVHSNGSGRIRVRSGSGRLMYDWKPRGFARHFSLTRFPTQSSEEAVVVQDTGSLNVYRLDGAALATYRLPTVTERGRLHAAVFRPNSSHPWILAVALDYWEWGRSMLFFYSDGPDPVFHQARDDSAGALAALSVNNNESQALLVGGTRRVDRYVAR